MSWQIFYSFKFQTQQSIYLNCLKNCLGFASHGNNDMLGNFGLWDQTAALEFISENIGAFGGDPNRISLIGYSAGAV